MPQVFKILTALGLELLFLVAKLVFLASLFYPVMTLCFCATWEGGEWGEVVFLAILGAYFLLAFFLIVWLPFHKYVYARLSRRDKHRLHLGAVLLLAMAALVFFAYPVRDRHMFVVEDQCGRDVYILKTKDTIWNWLFRGCHRLPDALYQKVVADIYTVKGEHVGHYKVGGALSYMKPNLLWDDGYFIIRDGDQVVKLPKPTLKR